LLNPTELYAEVHKGEAFENALAVRFAEQLETAIDAADQTARRLDDRLITDDDVVTALCFNALVCDQFERDIKDIPYLRTFSDRVGVFIDEYQDFSEQQVFLMGFRAKRKYRQITVAGDGSQRLHAGGIERIDRAFPYISESVRQIALDKNFRQSKWLAQLSNRFRGFTNGGIDYNGKEPCRAPIHAFDDRREFAGYIVSKISLLPGAASVVVISSTVETARSWFNLMAPSLESAFRNPIVSDRARLTERLKTHFTTPLEAKGLEFDVAVVPDISEFNEVDAISLNGLYVAVSRPRHALLLGCERSSLGHMVVKQLLDRGDLAPVWLSADDIE
jgi:DNA helicase IV